MTAKISFFNLGNADSTLIQVNGRNILWDFGNMQGEKHCDLPKELNSRNKNNFFEVVCFTHADEDHVKGMKDYFHLLHAEKYQTEGRKKIKDLWVPAALFLESRSDLCEDATVLKAEAKHRFLTLKKEIKVFSRPEALKEWVEEQEVKFDEVKHLIVDAGTCVPDWGIQEHGVEFFAHSPFKGHVDEKTEIDRNNAGIVAQVTFGNASRTKLILGSDIDSDVWADIVKVTKYHKKNVDRLKWDIFHTSHHCSYKSLNKDDKGETITPTIAEIKWALEVQGNVGGKIIIPSDVIPADYGKDDKQPVYRQAYNYYKSVSDKLKGYSIVLMENPSKEKPEPTEIDISDKELTKSEKVAIATSIASKSAVSGNWSYDRK